MMFSKKKHWYAFSYRHQNTHGSMYSGLPSRCVTKEIINANKEVARVPKGAVLVSCSYLGYMTEDKFQPPEMGKILKEQSNE